MHGRLRKLNATPTMNGGLGKYNTNQAMHGRLRKLNEAPTMTDGLGKYNTNPAMHDGLSKLNENPNIDCRFEQVQHKSSKA